MATSTSSAPDVRHGPPVTVRAATAAWFLAVGMGVAETVLILATLSGDLSTAGLAAQLGFRAVLYGGLFVVIDRYFRRGVPWSRWFLTGLLGTVGLASLLYEPIAWLADDGDFGALDLSATFVTAVALRTVHILAVVAACVLTLHRDSTPWFRRR